jgi:uncharacterized protein
MSNALRVNSLELLRRPGTERDVDINTDIGALGIEDPRFGRDTAVRIELRLESLTDGIVVKGTITTRWDGVCRRCAVESSDVLVSRVDELYQQVPSDPDAFELGDMLDLVPMVRELLLLDAPASPLCGPDCAGLCPTCGIDRNIDSCDCGAEPADPRWAALSEWQDRTAN